MGGVRESAQRWAEPKFEVRPLKRGELQAARKGGLIRWVETIGRHSEERATLGIRIKPRYWTSEVSSASVIHVATGMGSMEYGKKGHVFLSVWCNAYLNWPIPLSSPNDFPSRRLCATCAEKAQARGDMP